MIELYYYTIIMNEACLHSSGSYWVDRLGETNNVAANLIIMNTFEEAKNNTVSLPNSKDEDITPS